MNLRIRFRIPSDLERHAEARGRLARFLRATGKPLDEPTIIEMQLALDEALSNITRHSYKNGAGSIDLEFVATEDHIELILRDQGRGFEQTTDRSSLPPPEMEGGRGLCILQGIMGEVSYGKGAQGENILRLRRPDSHPRWTPSSSDEEKHC